MVSIPRTRRREEEITEAGHVEQAEGVLDRDKESSFTVQAEGGSAAQATQDSPRRPLTRSQTGRVSKRRLRDDSPPPAQAEPRARITRPRKKHQPGPEPDSAPVTALAPVYSITAPAAFATPAPLPSPLHDGSSTPSSSTDTLDITTNLPTSKIRANLPVPVPNLTKKSRGRRVPTKLPTTTTTSGTHTIESRMYICEVENCGKCFHRGEHLKRHIRSIHTHEKPFKCSHPLCDKHFNRHDNLLQHLKVHKQNRKPPSVKDNDDDDDGDDDDADDDDYDDMSPSPPPPPPTAPTSKSKSKPRQNRIQRSPSSSPVHISPPPPYIAPHRYYPSHPSSHPSPHEAYEASLQHARLSALYPRHPRHTPLSSISSSSSGSFRTYATYATEEPPGFAAANMAVSSLRTEIPQSPPMFRRVCDERACCD